METAKIKIFENGNVRDTLRRCLEEGYWPATDVEIRELIRRNEIPKDYYDTSIIRYGEEERTATKEELLDIEKMYEKGGRLLFLYYVYVGLSGSFNLDDSGRFVGVAPEARGKIETSGDSPLRTPTLEEVLQTIQPYVPEACKEDALGALNRLYQK